MKLDIYDISQKLIEATEAWEEEMKKYTKLEIEYQNTCDSLMTGDKVTGLGTQAMRDAEVRRQMQVDHLQLFTDYNVSALEVKLLRNRMQTLTTIAANLRTIGYSEK